MSDADGGGGSGASSRRATSSANPITRLFRRSTAPDHHADISNASATSDATFEQASLASTDYHAQIHAKDETIRQLRDETETFTETIRVINKDAADWKKKYMEAWRKKEELKEAVEQLQSEVKQTESRGKEEKAMVDSLARKIRQLESTNIHLQQTLSATNAQLVASLGEGGKDEVVLELELSLAERDALVDGLNRDVKALNDDVKRLEEEVEIWKRREQEALDRAGKLGDSVERMKKDRDAATAELKRLAAQVDALKAMETVNDSSPKEREIRGLGDELKAARDLVGVLQAKVVDGEVALTGVRKDLAATQLQQTQLQQTKLLASAATVGSPTSSRKKLATIPETDVSADYAQIVAQLEAHLAESKSSFRKAIDDLKSAHLDLDVSRAETMQAAKEIASLKLYTQKIENDLERTSRRASRSLRGSGDARDPTKPDWQLQIHIPHDAFNDDDVVPDHARIEDMDDAELRDVIHRLRDELNASRASTMQQDAATARLEKENRMLVERQVVLQRRINQSPATATDKVEERSAPSTDGYGSRKQRGLSMVSARFATGNSHIRSLSRHRRTDSQQSSTPPVSQSEYDDPEEPEHSAPMSRQHSQSGLDSPGSHVSFELHHAPSAASPLAVLDTHKALVASTREAFLASKRKSIIGDITASVIGPESTEERMARELLELRQELAEKDAIIRELQMIDEDDEEAVDQDGGYAQDTLRTETPPRRDHLNPQLTSTPLRRRSNSSRSSFGKRHPEGSLNYGIRQSEHYALRADCEQLQEEIRRLAQNRQDLDRDLTTKDQEVEMLRGQMNSILDRSRSFVHGGVDADTTAMTEFDPDRTHPIIRETEALIGSLRQEVKLLRMERDGVSEELQERINRLKDEAVAEMARLEWHVDKQAARLRVFGEEIPFEDEEQQAAINSSFSFGVVRRLRRSNAVLKKSLEQTIALISAENLPADDAWLFALRSYEDQQSKDDAADDDDIWNQLMEKFTSQEDHRKMQAMDRYIGEMEMLLQKKDMEIEHMDLSISRLERQCIRAEERLADADARAAVAEQVSAAIRQELVHRQREFDDLKSSKRRSMRVTSASGSTRGGDFSFSALGTQEDMAELLRQNDESLVGLEELARMSSRAIGTRDVSDVRSNASGQGESSSMTAILDALINCAQNFGNRLNDLIGRHCEVLRRIEGSSAQSTVSNRSPANRSPANHTRSAVRPADVDAFAELNRLLGETLAEMLATLESLLARALRRTRQLESETDTATEIGDDLVGARRSRTMRNSTSAQYNSSHASMLLAEERRKTAKLSEDVRMLQSILDAGERSNKGPESVMQLRQDNSHLQAELERLDQAVREREETVEQERLSHEVDVNKMHDKLERTRSKNQDQQRLLAQEVKYLREKFRREAGFRTDLGFQKRYFLHLLGGMEMSEQATLHLIASIMDEDRSGVGGMSDGSMVRNPQSRFRAAILAVIAIHRMRKLSQNWQSIRSIKYGSAAKNRPKSVISETTYQRI